MQDSRDVFARVLHQILGPLHVLHLPVQHSNEDLLYLVNCIHHLFDALQETLLHSKLSPTLA